MKCYCCTLCILAFYAVIWINLVKGSKDEQSDLFVDESYDTTEESNLNELSLRTFSEDTVKKNLVFHYYKNGSKTFEDKGLQANLTESGCVPSDKFAFLIHGWGQDCELDWVRRLREKLTERRGGCIVCVDYSFYKRDSYLRLLRYFRPMVNTITTKLQQLKSQGFEPNRGFIFGFSLGGQMASTIGSSFGPKQFKQIDTCDMAGPGFDFRKVFDHRVAAEQVNCWHTSRNKGTRFYSCHQNVRFGNCGHNQPGESALISSHSLCTEYYINAFDYPFYAVAQPTRCASRNPALFIPTNYTVGYTEDIKFNISGEVFVATGEKFPYNIPLKQIMRFNSLLENNVLKKSSRRRFPVFILSARNRLLQRLSDLE